ncbi:tetratricopeptide repeat-containing sulfotransferase family protein [Aestuariibacter salexigens]|uniref:tetratricopeptide repeat-containing sulfotransferase family protein n=1 Tax=Aestuariibacter salexigens TaxID=226010 RepID=UPI0004204203|nr:tetratricopeptide repeat-containing sulfotransferase family protein [Aestuariibacter salexigens]
MSEQQQLTYIKQLIQQSQLAQAMQQASALVSTCSAEIRVEALYMLAVAQRLSMRYEEALLTIESVLEHSPNHARAYQERGYCEQALNRTLPAASAFYRATQINPALLSAWRALLPLYESLSNQPAVKIATEQVEYLHSLPKQVLGALDLMYEGKLSLADKVCRQYLQQQKHQRDAMLCLAQIGIQMKVYSEAEFILESCVELHTDFFAASLELIKLYAKQAKFADALTLIERSLDKFNHHPQLVVARASALVGVGELNEAIAIYQQVLKKDDKQYAINLLLGHAYKAKGEFTEAITQYQHAYQNRHDLGDAFWSLANTKTYRFTEQEVAHMQEQVYAPDVAIDDRIHFAFALGKALEDRQQYDESFRYYAQGNALKSSVSGYDIARTEAYIDGIIEHFTPALFEHHGGAGCSDDAPIFIVGLPRAGSTLLEQILASHSQVDGTMELHNILSLAARLQKRGYPQGMAELPSDYLRRFGEQFIEQTQVYRQGAAYFIDKMPNNFMHVGLIKLILPNAKVIDARREPMACCFSGFKQLFGEGQEFTYSLNAIGRYYQAYVKLMKHWDKVLPGFVLRVQHEDVIDDLEGQVRRILDYCGLPFEQSCLYYYNTERTIKTPSSEQVRQPIFRSAMQQWQHFDDHLTELKSALKTG